MTDRALDRSNSLTDLAARINAEHEAASGSLKRGMQHAMSAGFMLIEAKARPELKHGQWLPWLKGNCMFSERTAQAYMRIARAFGKLGDESKAQRVADLSFRDAIRFVAKIGSEVAKHDVDRIIELVEDDKASTMLNAIDVKRAEDFARPPRPPVYPERQITVEIDDPEFLSLRRGLHERLRHAESLRQEATRLQEEADRLIANASAADKEIWKQQAVLKERFGVSIFMFNGALQERVFTGYLASNLAATLK
jgi:hypothetical protein